MRLSLACVTAAIIAVCPPAWSATLEIVPEPNAGVQDGATIPLGSLDLGVAQEGSVAALRRIFRDTGGTGAMLAVLPQILDQDETLHVARTLLALAQAATGNLDWAQQNLSLVEEAELQIPEVDMLRALLARETGDLQAARTHVARALAAAPEHAYAFHIRATLALAEGDTGAALQDFEAATRYGPDSALYWSNLGVALLNFGAVEAAADALGRAVSLEPGQCPTLIGLALLRTQEGKVQDATERLEDCLVADPNNAVAAQTLLSTHLRSGNVAAARESFGRFRRLIPNDRVWDATLSLREGRYDRVIETLQAGGLDALGQGLAQGKIVQGAAHLALGERPEARAAFQAAMALEGAPITAQVGLVALDIAEGTAPDVTAATNGADPAIDAFFAALAAPQSRLRSFEAAEDVLPGMTFVGLTPEHVDRALPPEHVRSVAQSMFLLLLEAPHAAQRLLTDLDYDLPYPVLSGYLQAYAAAKSGQTDADRQVALLERVTAAAPGFHAAQVMLAETLLLQNRPASALRAYAAAVETRATPATLLRVGLLAEATGNDGQAEQAYRQFASLAPDSPIALNQLAWFLTSRGQKLDEAQTLASRANEIRPGNASILDTLGWIAYLAKDYETALTYLREANEVSNGQNAEIRFHLAQAEMAAGNRVEALLHFEALDANEGTPLPFASEVKAALAQLKN
ncbi:MAG: tetratricopeptide repeat protein [Pseudomonadota bacterium]